MSLTVTEIQSQTLSKFKEEFPDIFTSQLLLVGFSLSEINQMSTIKEYVEDADEPNIAPTAEEESSKMESKSKKKALELLAQEAIADEKEMADGYNTQDASTSFQRAEPIFVEPNVTSPVDIQDADYSIVEDQPETYGAIDRVLNWWKINKKRKHAEFVHSSGTLLKINKTGDLTVDAIGSAKIVFEGDVSESIAGNKDFILSGKLYEHIIDDVLKQLDANFTMNTGGEVMMKSDGDTTIIGANINLNP